MSALRIRLASVQVTNPEPATTNPGESFALAKLVSTGRVYLLFDRTRFATDLTPLAYAIHEGSLVNAELVALGVAEPDPVPGNSVSLQRRITRAVQRRK